MPGVDEHRKFLKHFLDHQSLLKAYFLTATRSSVEADDLLQQVSNILWEKFEEYDPQRPFRAWALGIARIEALEWRRKKARSDKILSPEAIRVLADIALTADSEPAGFQAALQECLQQLPATWKRIVRLTYLESISIRQVAERIDSSVAAVEMALVRARRALRACVERKIGMSPEARP
jgi:RNA polymerase sigma-70 factor (ECF subfamily)